MKYRVHIGASKTGSIGVLYYEKRTYDIETDDREKVNKLAIARAYHEDLEHVRVERVTAIGA